MGYFVELKTNGWGGFSTKLRMIVVCVVETV